MGLGGFGGGLGFGVAFVLKDAFSASAAKINRGMDTLSSKTSKATGMITSKLKGLAVGFGLTAGIASAISKAADLSDQLVSLSKSTGMSSGEIESLRANLEGMDTRTDLTSLLGLAELGGQLGVTKDKLLEFTKAADMVGVVLAGDFGGSSEAATKKMAQLARAFGLVKDGDVTEGLLQISSAINKMGNVGGANASKVSQFVQKMGELKGLGPTASQAIALGSVFEELGVKSKGMASQFGNVVTVMGQSDENMTAFAKAIGLSKKAFKEMFNEKPGDAVFALAAKLGKLDEASRLQKLKELKLPSAEVAKLMGLMAGNTDLLTTRMKQAEDAMKDTSGMTREYAQRNATLKASIEKLKNKFENFVIRVGESIGMAFQPLIDVLADVFGWLTKLVTSPIGQTIIQMTINTIAFVGALILVKKTVTAISAGMKLLKANLLKTMIAFGPLLIVAAAVGGIVTIVQKATTAFANFNGEVKSGFGGFLQKLGGIIAAVKEIWNSWDSVNEEFSMSSGLMDKLAKLGILELAGAIGTWVVRVKEFLKGMVKGFKSALKFVGKVFKATFKPILKIFDYLGFSVGKNTSDIKKWGEAGKIAGMALVVVFGLLLIKMAALAIASVISFLPLILILGLVGLAAMLVYKGVMFLIDSFGSVWEMITRLFQAGKDIVYAIWDGIKSVWSSFTGWLMAKIKAVPVLGWAIEYMTGDGPSNIDKLKEQVIQQQIASGAVTQEEADALRAKVDKDNSVMNQGADNNAGSVQSMKQKAIEMINNIKLKADIIMDKEKVGEAMADFNENEQSRE